MTPWEDLADYWRGLGELQVYETMTEQLDVPCLVLMPDDPWIEPNGFSIDQERYLAYASLPHRQPRRRSVRPTSSSTSCATTCPRDGHSCRPALRPNVTTRALPTWRPRHG